MIRVLRVRRARPTTKLIPRHLSIAAPDAAADSECDRLVKQYDYENYMCSLFLPEDVRSSVLSTRAFNVELATIRDAARNNSLTGRLRFQFWRDVLDGAYADHSTTTSTTSATSTTSTTSSTASPPPALNPISRSLYSAVRQRSLNKRWLSRLLVAREKELENEELSDMGDYEEYAEAVGSSLMYLSLQCHGLRENQEEVLRYGGTYDEASYRAAGHVGRAMGMVTMLRGIPMTAEAGQRFTLPFWIMSTHGVKREDFLNGGPSTIIMRDAVLEAATAANNQLLDVKQMQEENEISSIAASALLPAALAQDFLTRLEDADFDIFSPTLMRSKWNNVQLMLRLYRLQSKGKILL